MLVALVAQHLGGIPAHQVCGFVDVGHGLVAVLPVLEGHQRGVRELPLGDQVRRALDDAHPLRVRRRGPPGERRLRRLDRLLRVDPRAFLEVPEHERRVGGARVLEHRVGPDLLAAYDQWVLRPELRADLVHRGLVVRMKLLRLPELHRVLPRPLVPEVHRPHALAATDGGAVNKVSPRATGRDQAFGPTGQSGRRHFTQLSKTGGYTMYASVEPSYLPYWAIAPTAASNSRAHSRVYEFGGISFVAPSHSKISLNADRCSSFVKPSSILAMRSSSRFMARTNSLH